MWIIINVSLTKIKIIMQKIEILEEMLIVNGCDASYCCLYSFIVDFHTLKWIDKGENAGNTMCGL